MSGSAAQGPLAAQRFHYRLRGELDGAEGVYLLREGVNTIGSLAESDVRLRVRGVSRRHAVVRVTENGEVDLEDLGSKNGTRVAGSEVEGEIRLWPGAEIEIGRARLVLESLEREDRHLALELEPAGAKTWAREGRGRSPLTPATTHQEGDGGAMTWLERAERVLEPLWSGPEPDPGAMLVRLTETLGLEGACLAEKRRDSPPAVLALRGVASAEAEAALSILHRRAVDASGTASGEGKALFHAELEPPWLGAWLGTPRAARSGEATTWHALVAWGERALAPPSHQLLRLALRAAASGTETAAPIGGEDELAELCLPEGALTCVSPAMKSVYRQLRILARSDLPVLVLGETGVGKEHLVRALHDSSPRAAAPFVALNCAALPESLLEAELFGIGQGVATGVSARPGRFRLAHGGTLFLDEIGEMPAALQAKLLRVLEEREVHPLGLPPAAIDVRVAAATNVDPLALGQEGSFRRDLYYRLAGDVVRVPPLRQRREDVPVLVEGFLRRLARRHGLAVRGLTVGALQRLIEAPWPGNVRELENVIQRLAHACRDIRVIDSSLLPKSLVPTALDGSGAAAGLDFERLGIERLGLADLELKDQVELLERRLVARALELTGGRRGAAARHLGIARNTLAAKIERYGLEPSSGEDEALNPLPRSRKD